MSSAIRGDNASLRIISDGVPVDIDTHVSFEASSNTEETEDFYIGRPDPETDALERGWSGSFTCYVKDDTMDNLLTAIMNARRSRLVAPVVNLVLTEYYPDESRARSKVFLDVQLFYSNYRTGGVNEKVQQTFNFKAAKMELA